MGLRPEPRCLRPERMDLRLLQMPAANELGPSTGALIDADRELDLRPERNISVVFNELGPWAGALIDTDKDDGPSDGAAIDADKPVGPATEPG